MAVCLVRWTTSPRSPQALQTGRWEVVYWEVSSLTGSDIRNTAKLLDEVMNYVERRKHVFMAAHIVAIEQQRGRMRTVAQGLYVALRGLEHQRVIFQAATAKLAPWTAPKTAPKTAPMTYAGRKRLAVEIVEELLQTKQGALAFYSAAEKRDDLADALLHALACSARVVNVRRKDEASEAATAVGNLYEEGELGA